MYSYTVSLMSLMKYAQNTASYHIYYLGPFSFSPDSSVVGSYENFELTPIKTSPTERTPLDLPVQPKLSMKKLVRQQSIMDTQKATDGTMQMTYWF